MAKIKFTVRALKRKDVKEIIKNYYARYEEVKRSPNLGLAMQVGKPSMKSELKWADKLFQDIKEDNAIALVAVVDGHVVGMCDIRTETIIEKQHVGNLGIAINEEYRGKGLGTALIKSIIYASKGRFEILRLEAFGVNKGAIKLYKRLGFKIYGVLPKGYMRGKRRIDQMLFYLKL